MSIRIDCPSKVYDLREAHLTDPKILQDFELWFKVPHEPPSQAPNDITQPPQTYQQEQSTSIDDDYNLLQQNCTSRKRYFGEISKETTVSTHATSALGRPMKRASVGGGDSSNHRQSTGALNKPAVKVIVVNKKTTTNTTAHTGSSSPYSTLKAAARIRSSSFSATSTTSSLSNTAQNQHPNTTTTTASRIPLALSTTTTTNKRTTRTSTSTTSSTSAVNSNSNKQPSIEQLLKEHNAKFAPIPVYEPPRHSVRDVKKWEKKTQRLWQELKPEERERVNEEIRVLKENNQL